MGDGIILSELEQQQQGIMYWIEVKGRLSRPRRGKDYRGSTGKKDLVEGLLEWKKGGS